LSVPAISIMNRVPSDARPAVPVLDFKKLDAPVRLAPRPVTVAPGIHQLGGMAPSAVYVIETSAGLVLVDAGLTEEHGALIRQMGELGLDPSQVRAFLLTHAHGDHSLGAMSFKHETGATIYAGRDDAQVLRDGGPYEALFSAFEMSGCEIHATDVDVELAGGEFLAFGDTRIEVLATPGHSPGSVCYVLNRGGLRVFLGGDTIMTSHMLGTYSAFLAPRYRGDARAFLATLRKLSALPIPDVLLPGHPRDDEFPQDPNVSPAQWLSMLEHGTHELEELIEHYENDGADFLDGEPKELLPDLHYLGDVDNRAVYVLATSSRLIVFDAPGGPGFPDWLDSRLRGSALESRPVTAVLLTSCAPESTSGLPALVDNTQCLVVSSASGVETLRSLGVPETRLLSVDAFEAAGWINVKTLPLADFRPEAMAYIIQWCGKTVLVSGGMPLQESTAEHETLARALAGRPEEVASYRESLNRLLDVNPNLWLPAEPRHGRNANVYSLDWFTLFSNSATVLQRIKPSRGENRGPEKPNMERESDAMPIKAS